uniref:SHNi-TPR domain-containing protein n=1 Tax=Caenorhabditis japonica TaxID=281687 RepID=A0A8R1HR50_CAEJA
MSALTDATNTIQSETENVGKPEIVNVEPVKAAAEVETPIEESTENITADVTETAAPAQTAAPVETNASTDETANENTSEVNQEESPMETKEVEETKEEKQKRLDEHMIAGRRFMKTSAFDKATEEFSAAAALSGELFDELHEDTFPIFYLYGQALLELAKVEDGVLNNALSEMPKPVEGQEDVQDDVVENTDDIPQDERADIKQKVEEALGVVEEEPIAEEEQKEDENVEEEEEEKVEEGKEVEEEAKTEEESANEEKTEDVVMESAEGEEQPVEEGEAEGEGEAEEDDETMKLAWEILETARLTCEEKIKKLVAETTVDQDNLKVWKLNQADVLATLGEHGIADSKLDQAKQDLFQALEIQKESLPQTSRAIANTAILLGKVFNMDSLFEKAAEHYTVSKTTLVAKMDELSKELESNASAVKEDIEAEIKELTSLIPEIDLLINDAVASQEQTNKLKDFAKKELEAAAVAIEKMAGVETTDITSLVRRPTKRPAEENESTEEVKKRKSEDGSATIPETATTETTGESETAPAPVSNEE